MIVFYELFIQVLFYFTPVHKLFITIFMKATSQKMLLVNLGRVRFFRNAIFFETWLFTKPDNQKFLQ